MSEIADTLIRFSEIAIEIANARTCEWSNYDLEECTYTTGCGTSIVLNNGYLQNSIYKFCPQCGCTIKDVSGYDPEGE